MISLEMTSSNPSSPTEITEIPVTITKIQGGLTRALTEEVSPLSTQREVGDVSVGVGEKSPIHKDVSKDSSVSSCGWCSRILSCNDFGWSSCWELAEVEDLVGEVLATRSSFF